MTIFDYLILLVLVCSVVISTLRGLVKEVLSLASWIIALVVANAYGEALAKMLPDAIPGDLIDGTMGNDADYATHGGLLNKNEIKN